ncbi:glycosyltransferase 87 family protein [Amycolatopsis sp. DG1A-15b]|uniref:glycosyltransferase 87 family protein n=1 Tax=Amycolatopsis sp. DG1A-15b TaxID=3052846 RepID=UPI00255BD898|nr:glycosyltransferase 87 family protein [Amycolatopsis sp. DG1A-15b]WIX89598.1 glycosyltransferase 87 family protein [Amycolatopsis sp. DG1A-15b]
MGTEVGQAPAWRRAARLFTAPSRTGEAAPLRWDLGFYLACLAFALPTALVSEFYGYRIWGTFATVAYGFGAAHSGYLLLSARSGRTPRGVPGSRWCGIAAVALLAMILPLALLVIRRLTGVDWLITPFSWAAQPEVWVIERSADLLLHHGTPYVDVTALGRPPVVNDYTPYGPVMAVFGLPRALFGGTPLTDALTDARWMFALAACACVLGTLKLLKWPRVPVGAAQLALACPLTALTWAVAGPDLAIVGLLVLSCALAATGRVAWSGLVLALVVSAKLIVAPAAAVLAVLVLVRRGRDRPDTRLDWAALGRFAAALVATTAAVHLPVYLVDPAAFVEHVFRFPLGMGVVRSPAASPLPGHLIAETGPFGQVTAFVLVGAAAVAMVVWLVRRPPANGSGALLRTAVGLGALILLTPATRYGYLVYPLVLLGAHLAFRVAEVPTAPPAQQSATTSS